MLLQWSNSSNVIHFLETFKDNTSLTFQQSFTGILSTRQSLKKIVNYQMLFTKINSPRWIDIFIAVCKLFNTLIIVYFYNLFFCFFFFCWHFSKFGPMTLNFASVTSGRDFVNQNWWKKSTNICYDFWIKKFEPDTLIFFNITGQFVKKII